MFLLNQADSHYQNRKYQIVCSSPSHPLEESIYNYKIQQHYLHSFYLGELNSLQTSCIIKFV